MGLESTFSLRPALPHLQRPRRAICRAATPNGLARWLAGHACLTTPGIGQARAWAQAGHAWRIPCEQEATFAIGPEQRGHWQAGTASNQPQRHYWGPVQ